MCIRTQVLCVFAELNNLRFSNLRKAICALQWRLTLPGDGKIMNLERQSRALTPFALAGSCRIDSMFSSKFVPAVSISLKCPKMDFFVGNSEDVKISLDNFHLMQEIWRGNKFKTVFHAHQKLSLQALQFQERLKF